MYYVGVFLLIVGICLFATPFFAVFGVISEGLPSFDDPDFGKPPKGVFSTFGLAFVGMLAIGAGGTLMRLGRAIRPPSDDELEDWADPSGPTS
ncbi:MAG: hypothetical protein ACYTGN_16495 [Planctomycetota bacterium]